MANSFSGALQTAVQRFWTTLQIDNTSYNQFATLRTDAIPSLKLAELRTGGSAGFGTWSGGSVSPVDYTAVGASAVSPTAYKKQMTVTKYDAEDNPDVLVQTAVKMASESAYKLSSLVWAAIAATATTDHPTISGKKIADSFTSPVSQTNKGTSALSISTLDAARVAMRQYKNHDGDIISFQNFKLVVGPGLEKVGKQLIMSSNYPNAASNGGESDIINPFQQNANDSGISGITVAPQLSDATDWALIATDEALKPFYLWFRSPIEFLITQDPSTQAFIFSSMFRANVMPKPECDAGIYYSLVTG